MVSSVVVIYTAITAASAILLFNANLIAAEVNNTDNVTEHVHQHQNLSEENNITSLHSHDDDHQHAVHDDMDHKDDHHQHLVPVLYAQFDFKCKDETAIHLSKQQVCDGEKHCPDGSDETTEACLLLNTCPPGQHKCLNESRCLVSEKLCDGTSDCLDGWDESELAGCPSKHMLSKNETGYCPEKYSACDSPFNRCIPDYAKCDFRKDCTNGEDEADCKERKCPDGYFHCYKTENLQQFYRHCIAIRFVCDHVPNCPNLEDESDNACDVLRPHVGHSDTDGHHHHGNVDRGVDKKDALAKPSSAASPTISTLLLIIGLFVVF